MGSRPILLVLVLTAGFLSGTRVYSVTATAFQSHPSIIIVGNEAFTQPNGVTGGSGTASDPYIIEGLEIQPSNVGIKIANTTAFFILRNVYVHSPPNTRGFYGVAFINVTNGRVEDVTSSDLYGGVVLVGSSRILILNSHFYSNSRDVTLRTSSFVTVLNNTVSDDFLGISLYNTQNIDIANNKIRGKAEFGVTHEPCRFVAVEASHANNLTIADNSISENEHGINIGSNLCEPDVGVTIFNVTISNNDIGNNSHGIWLRNVESTSIKNNKISNNIAGVDADKAFHLTFKNNTISSNRRGIELHSSQSVVLSNNLISQNSLGVNLDSSFQVTLSGNTLYSDGFVLGENPLLGGNLTLLDSYTFTADNKVNNKPVYFYRNCTGGLDLEAIEVGQLLIANCKGIVLTNVQIVDTDIAVQMFWIEDVLISQCIFSNNFEAVSLVSATNVTITDNTLSSNGRGFVNQGPFVRSAGIQIVHGVRISILRNKIAPLNQDAILAFKSTSVDIAENDISKNENRNWAGFVVEIYYGSNTTIKSNAISANEFGVLVEGYRNVTIEKNVVSWNKFVGIKISSSTGVSILDNDILSNGKSADPPAYPFQFACGILAANVTVIHNNLIDNALQACGGVRDIWDGGYPAGGNYWSDYAGKDNCSGSLQDICPSPDGVGDTPYVVDSDSQDRYPSMMPFVRANSPPVAFFSPRLRQGYQGTVFTLSASQSWDLDDSTGSLEARWDWEDDGIPDTDWSTVMVASHQYSTPGVYTIRLEVRDSGGLVDFANRQVLVLGDAVPPSWPASSALASTDVGNTIVTLNWSHATDNVRVASYRIYEGDKLLATLPGDAQTYTVSGLKPGTTYMFRVEAGDLADNWTSDGPSLTVTTAQPGPVPAAPQPSSWDNWFLLLVGAIVLVSALLAVRVRTVRSRRIR